MKITNVIKFLNIKKNFNLKILSILSAILLWLYIVFQRPQSKSIFVPLLITIPDSFVLDKSIPDSVRFDFYGSTRNFILFYKFGNPKISIDLKLLNEGENIVDILPENIYFPEWIGVIPQGKNNIKISAQIFDSILVPILLNNTENINTHWLIDSFSYNPKNIWIYGGRNDLENISNDGLKLKPFSINNFNYLKTCSTSIIIPEYPTKPYVKDSIIIFTMELDSLLLVKKKFEVEIIGSDRFNALPDSVLFYCLIKSKRFNQINKDSIFIQVEPEFEMMHKTNINFIWNADSIAESTWIEISKVKLIPK